MTLPKYRAGIKYAFRDELVEQARYIRKLKKIYPDDIDVLKKIAHENNSSWENVKTFWIKSYVFDRDLDYQRLLLKHRYTQLKLLFPNSNRNDD